MSSTLGNAFGTRDRVGVQTEEIAHANVQGPREDYPACLRQTRTWEWPDRDLGNGRTGKAGKGQIRKKSLSCQAKQAGFYPMDDGEMLKDT